MIVKSVWSAFRLTPEEKLKLAKVARRWRVSQSEVVRVLLANLDERAAMHTVVIVPSAMEQAKQDA